MLWLAVWAAGCTGGGGADRDCVPGKDPSLEIGVGLGGYEALADGGEFPLIHGPQGGYHLEIGLLARRIDGDDLISGELTGSIDGVVLARTSPWLDFRCDEDVGGLTSWGTRLIYEETPEFLDGKTTVVTARVTDLEGTTVEATSTFVIRDAP